MGVVIRMDSKRPSTQGRVGAFTPPAAPTSVPEEELPFMLSRLLAAGATDFTRIALDAWANKQLEPEELIELCSAYAAVMGLDTLWKDGPPPTV